MRKKVIGNSGLCNEGCGVAENTVSTTRAYNNEYKEAYASALISSRGRNREFLEKLRDIHKKTPVSLVKNTISDEFSQGVEFSIPISAETLAALSSCQSPGDRRIDIDVDPTMVVLHKSRKYQELAKENPYVSINYTIVKENGGSEVTCVGKHTIFVKASEFLNTEDNSDFANWDQVFEISVIVRITTVCNSNLGNNPTVMMIMAMNCARDILTQPIYAECYGSEWIKGTDGANSHAVAFSIWYQGEFPEKLDDLPRRNSATVVCDSIELSSSDSDTFSMSGDDDYGESSVVKFFKSVGSRPRSGRMAAILHPIKFSSAIPDNPPTNTQ